MRSTVPLRSAALLLLTTIGCGGGDGLPREPIAGTVTLDGRPLEAGMITFLPEGGGEPTVSVLIEDGAFALPRPEGPVPGPHRVAVWARRPTGKKIPDPDNRENIIDEMREVIPRRYNRDSGLKAEVTPAGANTFSFELSGVEEAKHARTTRAGLSRR